MTLQYARADVRHHDVRHNGVSHNDVRHNGVRHQGTPPVRTPRLRLKARAPESGFVDGACWPHTDDLTAELPDLLAVLSVRLGRIDRVLYKLDEWAAAPARLVTGGRAVRLDGYRHQPANTIEVFGLNRSKIVLLVVPPHTDPDTAHTAMMAAAGPNNDSTIDDLLTNSLPDKRSHTTPPTATAKERWDSEGGSQP